MIRNLDKVPRASFLEGEFGQYVLEQHNLLAKQLGSPDVLGVLKYKDGVVMGSNPFVAVAVNTILQRDFSGCHVATPAELEEVLQCETLQLREHYEDTALVLRGVGQPNSHLAVRLFEQLKRMNDGRVPKLPVMLPLAQLSLAKDAESQYGLAFELQEDAKPIRAPQLAYENNGKTFAKTDRNGLPVFKQNTSRTLYTIADGLSGLFLSRGADLGSNWVYLGNSNSGGRVPVYCAAGAKKL